MKQDYKRISLDNRQVIANADIKIKLKIEINKAINNKTSKGKITFNKVTDNIVQRVKALLKIDVSNRVHELVDNDIRHMINEHGDPIKEAKKDQIAITVEDILKIPDILELYDDIVKGNSNKNNETIRYIKKYEDGITYLVEVVAEKSNTLNIKTMWKKPTTLTNSQQTLSSTSETTDSSISSTSNLSIASSNENVNTTKYLMQNYGNNAKKSYQNLT